jgi:Sec-independent protein translocase protein TatA
MDFLGIGPLELIFVFIIILIVLGPNDMVKVGGTLGRYIRQIMRSDTWRVIQDTSREIRGLPTKLARQAGLEEFEKELREGMEFPKIGDIPKKVEEGLKEELQFDSWTNPVGSIPEENEPSIDPAEPAENSEPGEVSSLEENPKIKEELPLNDLPASNPSPTELDPHAEE